MDLSLDEFITKKKIGRGGRGGRGGGRRGGGGGRGEGGGRRGGGGGFRSQNNSFTRVGNIPDGKWSHDRFEGAGRSGGGGAQTGTAKLLISNLDWGVSDADITELFSEFGGLRRAGIHYDSSGRSIGSADVVFERRSDATRAMKQYNNVPLDGRPMKIELVGPGATATSSAVAKARQAANSRNSTGGGQRRSTGGGGRGGRGGRGGGGRGGGRRNEPVPTLEDLDKELDAYISKSS